MSKKTKKILFKKGQRVEIDRDEVSGRNLGQLAIIHEIEPGAGSEPTYLLKVDRVAEPVRYKQSWLRPVTPIPSSVLANDLCIPWEMSHPELGHKAFIEDNYLLGNVMERILFYQQVVIPTVDFAIVVPLVHWLGWQLFRDLLVAEAIRFVRFRGTLAYIGNGNGLATVEIHPGLDRHDVWWIRSSHCPVEEAIELQLQNRLQGLPDGIIPNLAKLIGVCTTETALPEFTQKVEGETYRDILTSPVLHSYVAIRNTNLKNLVGLDANQGRTLMTLRPSAVRDEIDLVLRLGMLNLEAYLAEESSARDMVTDRGFQALLSAKVDRFTGGKVAADSFSQFTQITRLPDIAKAISSGQLNTVDVWKFREKGVARNFRKWFDQTGPKDPNELLAQYVEALGSESIWDREPLKTIKFVVVQGAGLLVPAPFGQITGLGISAFESYLLEKIRLGFNPRYFVDDQRHNLFPEKK